MSTVQFDTTFILAAVNLEMKKANEATNELNHLASIGYLNSQTGLDKAEEVKMHLTKAYALLDKVNFPGTDATKAGIKSTIVTQDTIIDGIKFSIKLKEMGLI